MYCRSCDHIWTENWLTNVLISVWIAHVQSLRCPECGSRELDWVINEERVRARLAARNTSANSE